MITFTLAGADDAEHKILSLASTKSEDSGEIRTIAINRRLVNGKFVISRTGPDIGAITFEGIFRENAEITILVPVDSLLACCCMEGAAQLRIGKEKAENMKGQCVAFTPMPGRSSFDFTVKFMGGELSRFTMAWVYHVSESVYFGKNVRELAEKRRLDGRRLVLRQMPRTFSSLEEMFAARLSNAASRSFFIAGEILRVAGFILDTTFDEDRQLMEFDSYEKLMLRNIPERMMLDAASPPTIEDMAREIGISSTKLKAGFREIYGMAPYAYFKKVKLKRAFELIPRRELTIREIAFQCGYSSQSQFCEAFKREYGVTPSQMRKQGNIQGENKA